MSENKQPYNIKSFIPIFPALILVFADAPALELLKVSLMPAIAVIIGHVAHLSRLLRAGFIEAMNCEFIERARLSGVPEKRIVFRHALPASVIPSLNSVALFIAGLLNGLIVIEKVLKLPVLFLNFLLDLIVYFEVLSLPQLVQVP